MGWGSGPDGGERVDGIVGDGVTEVLEVDSDLMGWSDHRRKTTEDKRAKSASVRRVSLASRYPSSTRNERPEQSRGA